MSFVVADDVSPPQTFRSKSVTSYPFRASSHVTPDPLIPPPTTAIRIRLIVTPVDLAKFVQRSETGCWVTGLRGGEIRGLSQQPSNSATPATQQRSNPSNPSNSVPQQFRNPAT